MGLNGGGEEHTCQKITPLPHLFHYILCTIVCVSVAYHIQILMPIMTNPIVEAQLCTHIYVNSYT